MAKYAVEITETSQRTVIVEATDFKAACAKVEDAYDDAKIILDPDDLTSKEFSASETFGKDAIAEDNESLPYFQVLDI